MQKLHPISKSANRVKYTKFLLLVVVVLLLSPEISISQEIEPGEKIVNSAEKTSFDTISTRIHSPHKATLYSLILPGAGQAYNKKYWKIPLIYAGFGVFIYFINYNDSEYKKFREAYYHSLLNDSTPPVNDYEEKYTSDQLLSAKDDFRRNRDLSYILAGIWYLLNVVDATVDAHLFNWEVDDNLSMKIEPAIYNRNTAYMPGGGGIKLTLRF